MMTPPTTNGRLHKKYGLRRTGIFFFTYPFFKLIWTTSTAMPVATSWWTSATVEKNIFIASDEESGSDLVAYTHAFFDRLSEANTRP